MVLTESVPQIRRNETGLGAPRKVAFLTAGGLAPCLSSSVGGLITEYAVKHPQTEIICYAPSCKDAFGMTVNENDNDGMWEPCFGDVTLSVTINRQEFFGALTFRYMDRQLITKTVPW